MIDQICQCCSTVCWRIYQLLNKIEACSLCLRLWKVECWCGDGLFVCRKKLMPWLVQGGGEVSRPNFCSCSTPPPPNSKFLECRCDLQERLSLFPPSSVSEIREGRSLHVRDLVLRSLLCSSGASRLISIVCEKETTHPPDVQQPGGPRHLPFKNLISGDIVIGGDPHPPSRDF